MRLILFALLFAGCASTQVFDPVTGKRIFKTQADASNVTVTSQNVSFHADSLNHSTPTMAQGKAASDKIGAVAGAAGALGVGTFLTR